MRFSRWCLSGRGLGLGSLLGSVGLDLLGVGLLVRLVRAVDGDLDGDLASLNLLAVHLRDGLLLQFLRSQGNETKTTALASLTTSLELLDHESGDGSEGDLGGGRLVGGEELLELWMGLAGPRGNRVTRAKRVEGTVRFLPSPRSTRTAGWQP